MTITEVLLVLCLLIFATLLGKNLLSNVPSLSNKSNITAFAYGAISLSYIFILLGAVRLLYKNTLIATFVILVISITFRTTTNPSRLFWNKSLLSTNFGVCFNSTRSRWHHITLVLLPLVFLYQKILVGFLNPITGYDALAYHIYAPLHALNYSHVFNASELIPNAGLPLGYQAIYGWIAPFTPMHAFALLNLCFIVLTISACYQSIKRERVLVLIAICYSVIGLILFCGSMVVLSPTSDVALMFFSLLVVIQLIDMDSNFSSHQELFLHGLLLGFLPMIKPFAMVLVIPLLIIHFVNILKTSKISYESIHKGSALLIGLLPYLAWSVKNYVQIGNPFFPMLQGVFQGSGYGPEVMTNEEDVRRSFDQLFQFLHDNPFGGPSMGAQHAQLAIFVLISIFSIFGCFHSNRNFRYLFISTVLAQSFLIVIIGPIFRYFLFISVSQIYLLAKSSYGRTFNKTLTPLSGKSDKTTYVLRSAFLSLSLFIGTLSIISPPEFNRIPSSQLSGLRDFGIDVPEQSFQNVINFIHGNWINKPKSILLLGEGRAAAFWPMNVKVYAADRRNPFANPSINTPSRAMSELQLTGSDLFIIASDWGFLPNVNQDLISDFERQYNSRLLFVQPGWTIYDLR